MAGKKGSGKNVTKTVVKADDSGPSTKKLSAKNGRPSRYHKDFDKIAHGLALLGSTNDELASAFKVSNTTIDNWIKMHPTFAAQVRGGRLLADANVASALYQRAVGGTVVQEWREGVDKDGEVYQLRTQKELPADVNAAKHWLNNRQRDKWKERQEAEDNSGNGFQLVIHETLRPDAAKDGD